MSFLYGISKILTLIAQSEAVLLFAGDAMQHKAQLDAASMGDGIYSYVECFAPVKAMVSEADFAVVNLETPLGGKPYRGYPCFSAPDSYARALVETGFDLLLTANNHTLDARDRGLRRTIAALDSLAIPHIGTYTDSSARKREIPKIINIKGFKVGFLNYTYGTNGIDVQGDVVVDYIDKATIEADIAASRNAGAEIICVAVHWGDEYKLLPNASQKALASWLCDKGVDIIFGGHPHVIQPMELVDNPVTGKKTALFYSLGNFISNMKTRDTRGGAVARVTLKRDSCGIARVDNLSYSLVFTVPPGATSAPDKNFKLYPVEHEVFTATPLPAGNDSTATSVQALPHIRANMNAFVSSATAIFDKYNKNVIVYTPPQ